MTNLRYALVLVVLEANSTIAYAQSQELPTGFSLAPGFGERPVVSQTGTFPLSSPTGAAAFVSDPDDFAVVSIAEQAVAEDVEQVSGQKPAVLSAQNALPKICVLAGTLDHSQLIDRLVKRGKIDRALLTAIRGKLECFALQEIANPLPGVDQALVVVGSDRRGTAYGLFELSRLIGVSPLVWWADVAPVKHPQLLLKPAHFASNPPAVKFRGIFLNDEDWALHPWAANHLDADIKDIGPKTYAKVFELLLRMRGNLIWPAMHACTKAFYHYPDNPKTADAYAIVVGSSHAEPMLRNNVFEWQHFLTEPGQNKGEYRFDTNADQVTQYWRERVKQSQGYESIYTIGMRGIHDSAIVMAKTATDADRVDLMTKVIGVQRGLLGEILQKPLPEIPQIFCPYKEVLGIYRAGLHLPDDITIIWPDDNHGYIRQLSSPQEQKRSGGSGVYYHLSYYGAPEDYLWLCSTSPELMSYEVHQGLATGANRLWVFNVGDLKPAEMEMEYAMDLTWNPTLSPEKYIRDWSAATFGEPFADPLAKLKHQYYELAQGGKPEHVWKVGYSQQEAQDRLTRYTELGSMATSLGKTIPPSLQDAYYEMILYPMLGSGQMNEKVLEAKLGQLDKAQGAFQQIQDLTARYNSLAGGKWTGMMDWEPRKQKAYGEPTFFKDPKNSPPLSQTPFTAIDLSRPTAFTEISPGTLTRLPYLGGPVAMGRDACSRDTFPPDQAPSIEYTVPVTAGSHSFHVHCLPGHPLYHGLNFRIGLSIDHGPLQITDLDTAEFSPPWGINVLRGYAEAVIPFTCTNGAQVTLRLSFPDPGMVVTAISVE